MEGAMRKRKRAAEIGEPKTCDRREQQGQQEAHTTPSSETKDGGGDESGAAPPPSEAEVEEFYAILRRMRAAVKYFNGVRDRRDSGREAVRNGGLQLDLNAVPESENNGA